MTDLVTDEQHRIRQVAEILYLCFLQIRFTNIYVSLTGHSVKDYEVQCLESTLKAQSSKS